MINGNNMDSTYNLTEMQKWFIKMMYQMGLTPDAKHIQSSTIIGRVIGDTSGFFSDSISEHIEQFYALGQPWHTFPPLIELRGNFGCAEFTVYEWDGAAIPPYTEARLSERGMKYYVDNKLKDWRLPM